MTVASCPSCQESVTVPLDAYPESIVRCPLCHGEFKLEAFLSQLPPPLIVVPPAGAEVEEEPDLPYVADEGPAGELGASQGEAGEVQTAEPAEMPHDDAPAFDFIPGSADATGEAQVDVSKRSIRRQKSTGWEIAKIVGGALLAVPAAQLILWWFVPGTWKRDLLGIGPPVSRVVPWIVPEKFRASRDSSLEGGFPAQSDGDGSSIVQRRRAKSRLDNAASMPLPGAELPELSPRKTPAADDDDRAGGPPTDPAKLADGTLRKTTVTDTPDGGEGSVDKKTEADLAVEPDEAAMTSHKKTGLKTPSVPEFGVDALRSALEAARQANIAWDTPPDQSAEHQAALTDEFYRAFARLGETVSFMKPGDPAARDLATTMQNLLLSFAEQPHKLAMIGNRTFEWLAQESRPNRGVFLFGTVKHIELQGNVFATELELASRNQRVVTVISRHDPRKLYGENDRILMLGAVVENPAANLDGYAGTEPMVVIGSFPVPLPR